MSIGCGSISRRTDPTPAMTADSARTLGLVHSERVGRNIVYSLYDNRLAPLIDEADYHAEHLRLGAPDCHVGRHEALVALP